MQLITFCGLSFGWKIEHTSGIIPFSSRPMKIFTKVKLFDIQCRIEEQKVSWMHLISKAQPLKLWEASRKSTLNVLKWVQSQFAWQSAIITQRKWVPPFYISFNYLQGNLWRRLLKGIFFGFMEVFWHHIYLLNKLQ